MVTRLASSHGVQEQSRVEYTSHTVDTRHGGVNKKEVTGRVFSENQDNNIQSLEYCVQIVENVLKTNTSQGKLTVAFLIHYFLSSFA